MKKFIPALLLSTSTIFANMPPGGFGAYPNEYFVETGTYQGNGITNAKQGAFKEFHTIEAYKDFYFQALERYFSDQNVHPYYGDSAKTLARVIKNIHKPITFWLDAHVFPPKEGIQNCPLIEELEAIKQHPIKTHTILIDDLNCCGTLAFDYLTLADLKKKILEINPEYHIKLIAGGDNAEVAENILVATIDKE